jgi:hypothetical protein
MVHPHGLISGTLVQTFHMAHKLAIKRQRTQIVNSVQEEFLLDEPLFIQFNKWTTIGIYPKNYDFTDQCDGQNQTFAGTPTRGLTYKCYTIHSRLGSRQRIQFDDIADWSLRTLDQEMIEGERGDLISLILLKPNYDHKIAESEFLDRLSAAIDGLLPKDRIHAQFQKRTH